MHVAIRADGSSEMGYGHLFRSNSVATALVTQGDSVTYITQTPEQSTSVCNDEVKIVPLEDGNPDTVASKLDEINADATFVDLPEAPFDLQQAIQKVNPLAVFLGSAREKLCCDILVNGHLFAENENYEWTGSEPTWCLGPKYLPLREPFPEIATREKDCKKEPERGLILMGGSDPHNITPKVMRAFDPLGIDVSVIVGPGNEHHREIEEVAIGLDSDFEVLQDPDDLPERMFGADIAVSGFGTTVYELMASKTPFIGIARNKLEQEGATKIAQSIEIDISFFERNVQEAQLTSKLIELQNNEVRRTELQSNFRNLIDGQGAKRIIKGIQHMVDE